MTKKITYEGLGELAAAAESDHEVQMARADLYKIAKYAIKLHEMMAKLDPDTDLESWVQAKLVKAADYVGTVYHYLDGEMNAGTELPVIDEPKNPEAYGGVVGSGEVDELVVASMAEKTNVRKKKLVDSEKVYMSYMASKLAERTEAMRSEVKKLQQEGKKQQSGFKKSLKTDVKPAPKRKDPNAAAMKSNSKAFGQAGPMVDRKKQGKKTTARGKVNLESSKKKGLDGKACWKGYRKAGTQQKGGKTVDNCVKVNR